MTLQGIARVALAALGISASVSAFALPGHPSDAAHGISMQSHVHFVGNRALSTTALAAALVAEHAHSIEAIAAAVEKTYLSHGYLAVHIEWSVDALDEATVHIGEGDVFTIRRIEVVEPGNHHKDALNDPARNRALFELQDGDRFDRDKLLVALRRVQDRYVRAGYAGSVVTPITSVDLEARTIAIRVELERKR